MKTANGSNVELKDFIDIVLEGITAEQDISSKKYFSIAGSLVDLAESIPDAEANFSDLQNELNGLSQPANQQDLITYIEGKFPQLGSGKSQTVLNAILPVLGTLSQLVTQCIAIEAAVKS